MRPGFLLVVADLGQPEFTCQTFPELINQNATAHGLDLAGLHVEQLKRSVGHADQPVHVELEVRQNLTDFAVLALAQADRQPDVGTLNAIEARLHRPVTDPLDLDAVLQAVELLLRDAAVRAHAVAAQPSRGRKLHIPRQPAIGGEQQQAFRIEVQTANRDNPRHVLGHLFEHRRTTFRVAVGRHHASRLVVAPQPHGLDAWQRLAVDHDLIFGPNVQRRCFQNLAVDRYATFLDPALGVPARAQPGTRHRLRDPHGIGLLVRFRSGPRTFGSGMTAWRLTRLGFAHESCLSRFGSRPLWHCPVKEATCSLL